MSIWTQSVAVRAPRPRSTLPVRATDMTDGRVAGGGWGGGAGGVGGWQGGVEGWQGGGGRVAEGGGRGEGVWGVGVVRGGLVWTAVECHVYLILII